MSKHKVTRYDDGGDVDAMEMANKGENLDTEAGPKVMPRRPVSRTPASEPSRMSGPGRKPTGPSAADEPRDRFGIPGKVGKSSAPGPNTIDSSELERNINAAGNSLGLGGAMSGMRRVGAAGDAVSKMRAGRTAAKEAPEVVSAARGALDRAMSVERASPKTGDMAKINDALKAFKNKPATKTAPKPKAKRDDIGRADTLDENGAAMKRGGSVKKYASGGFTRSADGCAERGKTRAQQFCGGGMSKGRK
jgi:hypothetical protein